VGMICPQL
jgi:EIN3-binding F-box protein